MKQTLRLRKLVKPGMQMRLIMAFVGAALVSTIVQAAVLNSVMANLATKLPSDETILLNEWPSILRTSIASTALMTTFLVVGIGVLATHRIAGASYRLESYLRGVMAGEESEPCTLREKDQLQELCGLINEATQEARTRRGSSETSAVEETPRQAA